MKDTENKNYSKQFKKKIKLRRIKRKCCDEISTAEK